MPEGYTLESLRRRLDEILDGLQHPPLGAATALAEECGEVAKLVLDHHAYGGPLDSHALGGELVDVMVCLCEIASQHGIDLAKSWFYTDSVTDLPLLERVGHPVVTNPDPLLYRRAVQRHWPVRFFRAPGTTDGELASGAD